MEKLVKITLAPHLPNTEVIDNLVIKVGAPYSDRNVTLEINPSLEDYKEDNDQEGIQIRQVMVTAAANESKKLTFDFESKNTESLQSGGDRYEIKLMNIVKEKTEEGEFMSFEFLVKKN